MKTRVLCVLAALTLLAIGNLAHSATITWTNLSGGNWLAATNWTPNQVPANADNVRITSPGTYTITINSGTSVASLMLGAGGGVAGVQTLAMTHPSGSAFQSVTTIVTNGGVFNALNIDFDGPVTVANGGVFTESGVLMNSLKVDPGGVLNMVDGPFLGLAGPMTNAGTINLTNSTINMYNTIFYGTGSLVNQAGGVINIRGNGLITSNPGDFDRGYFINQGTLLHSAGTNASINVSTFNNTLGTVSNWSGTFALRILREGLSGNYDAAAGTLVLTIFQTNSPAGTYPLAGTFNAGAGATIQIGVTGDFITNASPFILSTPLVLGGSGRYQFTSGLLLLTTNTIPKLELTGGTLQLGAGFQGGAITNLTLNGIGMAVTLPLNGKLVATNSTVGGNFTVPNGSTLGGSNAYVYDTVTVANGGVVTFHGLRAGKFNVSTGGQLNVAGSWVLGPITNAGTINITNAGLMRFQSPGGLVNQAGGSVNFVGNGGAISYFSGPEYFINQGRLNQISGPGTTNTVLFSTFFDNSQGTVTNSSGNLMLSFQGPLAGSYGAAPGAVIKFLGSTSASPLTPGTPLTLVGDCRMAGQVLVPYGESTYFLGGGYLYLPTNVVPGLGLSGGALQLGPGFQGGAITNLTTGGITFTNTLPVTGKFTATNSGFSSAVLAGNFTVANGGVLLVRGLVFYGGVTVASGGSMNVDGSLYLYVPLTNAGTINLTNYSIGLNTGVPISGGILNQPTGGIEIWGDAGLYEIYGSSGTGHLVNQGHITKHAGTNTSGLDVRFTTNSGVITAKSGAVGLGYRGPASLQPGSSLNVVLKGATNFSKIRFDGAAPLGGAFNVTLTNGFVPAQGDSFAVASYVSHSGNFASLGLPPVVNWQSAYTSTNFVVTVEGITTSSPLPAGTAGTAYNHTLTAVGGTLPYTWSVISGGLPSGLSLSTNGVISGTPGMATNASFTARVVGGSLSATKAFTLMIQPAVPTITTASPLPSGTAGAAYNQTFAASNSTTPYTWSVTSGSLPAGLSLNTNGVISGTPTGATVASFTVQVVGGNGLSTNKVFGLTIIANPLPAAVDNSGLVWTTGGNAPWFAQTTNTHDGVDAAQSGLITHGQESWMQTTLTGPGTLTYWRKVSSEPGYDYLEFYLDGVLQSGRIAGTVDWQKQTNSIPAGVHTAKWRYMKDPECCTEGQDAGRVDEVSYAGSTQLQFAITNGSPSVSNGLFITRLTGPAGTNVVVDRSFNLTNWTPLQTNPLPVGGLDLAVPLGTNRQQFFRARMP